MKKLFIIIVLVSVYSCNRGDRMEVSEKWENGNNKVVRTYENSDDTLTFLYEGYYEDGKPSIRGNKLHGYKNGTWRWWYSNGNMKDEAKFSIGNYIEERKHWRENGTLRLVEYINGECIDDCCNGRLVFYNEKGEKMNEFTQKDGQFDGVGYVYYPNGKLSRKFTYIKGEKQGYSCDYYQNGMISAEGNFLNNNKDSIWIFKDSLGNVKSKDLYRDGQLNGISYEYYPNGNIKFKGKYIEGKEEGYWVYFDSTGVEYTKYFEVKGEIVTKQ